LTGAAFKQAPRHSECAVGRTTDLNEVSGDSAFTLVRPHIQRERTQRHTLLLEAGRDLGPVLPDENGLWHDDLTTKLVAHFDQSRADEAPPRNPVLVVSDRSPL
jgi:hypothetical protein